MNTYAVDFETFYSDECSVRVLGNRGYFSHPDFDAYMVSVVGSDGYEFCGHPKLFDWKMLEGHRVISHNAAFDETLYLFGVEQGWYPEVTFAEWHCTADLCAYFNIPRSLKGAVKWIWKEEMPKTTRDNMKNRRWELMSPEFKAEVTEYALKDSRYCLRVWDELSESWPEQEKWISCHTRRMMRRGLPMDLDMLHNNLRNTKQVLFDAEAMIPWAGDKPLLSPKAFAEECRKYGIDPPASLAIDSEEADSWIETYGEKLPWATAVRSWRSVNALIKKLEGFERGTLDGRYYGGLMYCGGHTKRFSGSGGNGNMQNLPKKVMHGANIRNMIRAAPGKKLVAVDLSQIEIRTVLWLAQDKKALEMLRRIPDIYMAFAVMFRRWSEEMGDLKKNDPALRDNMKQVGLGCFFGASATKLAQVSGKTVEESASFIRTVLKNLPSVPRLWKSLGSSLAAARKDGVLELMLPSGNRLIYRDVKSSGDRNTTATIVKNGSPMTVRLWHGSLIENCLAGSTEVMTDRGWVPITSVTLRDRVWDGDYFVTHRGLLDRGVKPVIECHSVICTPDHKFLVGDSWVEAEKARLVPVSTVLLPYGAIKESEGPHGEEIWPSGCDSPAVQDQEEHHVGSSVRLRGDVEKELRGSEGLRVLLRGLFPFAGLFKRSQRNAREVEPQAVCSVEVDARPLPPSYAPSVEKLRGPRNFGMRKMVGVLSKLLGRHGALVERGSLLGQKGQQWGLQPGQLPLGDVQSECAEYAGVENTELGTGLGRQEQDREKHDVLPDCERLESGGCMHGAPERRVFDLLDCGPRNRFVVRGGLGKPELIAHNCAQSLARDVFVDCIRRIEEKGYPLILHIHDEVLVEVDEDKAEQCLRDCIEIMSTPPKWISDIPLSAEGKILDRYEK